MTAVVLAYYPGLNGPYVLDDGENITQNDRVAISEISIQSLCSAAASNDSGILGRPIAALSFALNHYFARGFEDTLPFKLTNLGIHLINTLLVLSLAQLLLRTPPFRTVNDETRLILALGVASVWSLHPIQLTSVLYVVQRMTSLSALAVLSGLILFCRGRLLLAQDRYGGLVRMYVGLLGGTLLGLGAKENAALLPLFGGVIEFALFRFDTVSRELRFSLRIFYGTTILFPVLIASAILLTHPSFVLDPYAERPFTVIQRVLTEARILWHYLGLLVFPDLRRLGLFQDDFPLSQGLLEPPETLLAILALAALSVASLLLAKRAPILLFGTAWFLTAHLIESSVFGLELAYEHRNYVASFGVIFAAISFVALKLGSPRRFTCAATVSVAMLAVVLAFVTWVRAFMWGDINRLAQYEARHHPLSARANDFAARVSLYRAHDLLGAVRYVDQGIAVAPTEAGFRIDMRLILAQLEVEINNSTSIASKMTAAHPRTFVLRGTPENVQTTYAHGRIRLAHSATGSLAITELLASEPITAHTIVSLEMLLQCIRDPKNPCSRLRHEAVEWLTAAANNSRTSPTYTAIVAADLARTHALFGDFTAALTEIERARALAPAETSYRLGQIEYQIRLGRLEQARVALDELLAANHKGAVAARHKETMGTLDALYATTLHTRAPHKRLE